MGANKDRKRKNSSKGETPKSTKGTKDAKRSEVKSDDVIIPSDIVTVDQSSSTNGSFLQLLNCDINTDNSPVFGVNYPEYSTMAQVQSNNGSSYNSPQQYVQLPYIGQCQSPVTVMPSNLAGQAQSVGRMVTPSVVHTDSKNVTNEELMKFISGKFEEMNSRLSKLESVEKKVNSLDDKLNKLWTDLDKRVAKSEDRVSTLQDTVEAYDYELDNTKEKVTALQAENKKLRESLADLHSKSLMCNLIIGGIKETTNESPDQTLANVKNYFKDNLKIPDENIATIEIESARRFGEKKGDKPKNVLVTFKDLKSKNYVKSFRENVNPRETGMFMHDQFPPEIVAQRKKLIPIMKKAREAKKEAYIKYNKLIVEGKVYTDGPFGTVP